MTDLEQLRALADDGSPHSRQFQRELTIAILTAVRRMTPVQRRQYLAGRNR